MLILNLIHACKVGPKFGSKCRQSYSIWRTLICKNSIDHSDIVGASPVGVAPAYIFILELTPDFNGLGKDNSKTRPKKI